jgi:hypothetical protein
VPRPRTPPRCCRSALIGTVTVNASAETPDVNDNPKDLRTSPIQRSSAGQVNADLAAEHAPGDRKPGEDMAARQEQLLDEAVEETFPASDPISVAQIT